MPGINIHFTRRMMTLLTIILVGPWLIVAILQISPGLSQSDKKSLPSGASSHIVVGNSGPWGTLVCANITIDLPDEFVVLPPLDQPPITWLFPGYSSEQVTEFLKAADLPRPQIDKLLETAKTAAGVDGSPGTALLPSDELVLSLSAAARAKIYSLLIECSENDKWAELVWFRPETLDEQLSDSELVPASIKLLKSLLYRNNGSDLLLFLDRATALRQLPDDRERKLFLKAISRKTAVFARLKIDPQSDVETLANYWGLGGRRKDLIPLLNSARRIEEGWGISLVSLLPPFMRVRLGTYPFPGVNAEAVKQDCFWSAFNAFNETPDDHFNDMEYVRKKLESEYYQIFEPSQLGDVILLSTAKDTVVHAAVYLADDVVFTKNGAHYSQPWLLMHMKDMLATYAVRFPLSGPLKVLYFRKKSL